MSTRMYSEEEKIAYVEEFKASEMSIKAYAEEKGIPDTTLRGWLKQDRALAFGEIDINPKPVAPAKIPQKKSIVLAMENIRIELKEGYNKEFLKSLIEVLENAY